MVGLWARKVRCAVVAAGVLLAAPAAAETTTEADKLQAELAHLNEVGNHADALPIAQRVLALREMMLGPDHTDVANALSTLAELYSQLGAYDQAEPHYKRSLIVREKTLGSHHLDVGQSGLLPVSWTLGLGVMMEPEVAYAEASVYA